MFRLPLAKKKTFLPPAPAAAAAAAAAVSKNLSLLSIPALPWIFANTIKEIMVTSFFEIPQLYQPSL